MKTTRIRAVALLIVVSGLALHVARAQQPGIKRTDLQRHEEDALLFGLLVARMWVDSKSRPNGSFS